MPICTKCKIEKSADQFHFKMKKFNILRSECKLCSKKRSDDWRKKNPEKIKLYDDKYKKQNYLSECINCKKVFTKKNQLETCSVKCYIEGYSKKTVGGCWEWQKGISPSGYGVSTFEGKQYRTHKLSYLIFKGEIKEGLLVCHKCDNPICCNPEHLFLGSPKQNMLDCSQKGRNTKDRMFFRKHSEDTAKICFELWQLGTSILEISKDMDMHFTSVYYLIKKHAKKIGFDFTQHPIKSNKELPKFLKIPREKAQEIIMLRKEGKTFLEISKLTEVKLSTCKYICKFPERLKE